MQRIKSHGRGGQVRRQRAGDQGKVLFKLDKICKDLNVNPNTENELTIVDSVISKVSEILSDYPIELLRNPPTLLGSPIPSFNSQQRELLEKIREAIHNVRKYCLFVIISFHLI